MTICIATNIYFPSTGGIPSYYKYLSDILISFGHRVIILTIDETGEEDSYQKNELLAIVTLRKSYQHYLSSYKKYFRPGSYTAYKWIAMGYAMRDWLLKNHKEHKIDMIETSDFGGVGIFLVDNCLPAVMVIAHSSATQIHQHSPLNDDDHLKVITELEKLSFTHCAGIIAHSPMNQQELNTLAGRNIEFARAPWIPPLQTGQNKNPAYPHIVAGSLQKIKGAEFMARVTRSICKKIPDWQIHWCGSDSHTGPGTGLLSPYLENKYRDIWNRNFKWMGERKHEEALKMIAEAKLTVIPSLWDTFNYTALESAYFQVPVVMTSTTGSSYLFENDPNVDIVSSGDEMLFAQTIINRVSTGEPADTNSRQKLASYFSPENILKDRLAIYESHRIERKPIVTGTDLLGFLNKYTQPSRKYYYWVRRQLKSFLKNS